MLLIKKIEKKLDIQYKSFLNGDINFNFVSNLQDDTFDTLYCCNNGLILLTKMGIICEIELLFPNPIKQHYPTFECAVVEEGVPIFEVDAKENEIFQNVIFFLESKIKKAFILFDPKYKKIDKIVSYLNVNFFIFDKSLIGIEFLDIIFDADDVDQMQWLDRKNNDK